MYPLHNLRQVGRCGFVAPRNLEWQMLGILNPFIEGAEHLGIGFHGSGLFCLYSPLMLVFQFQVFGNYVLCVFSFVGFSPQIYFIFLLLSFNPCSTPVTWSIRLFIISLTSSKPLKYCTKFWSTETSGWGNAHDGLSRKSSVRRLFPFSLSF